MDGGVRDMRVSVVGPSFLTLQASLSGVPLSLPTLQASLSGGPILHYHQCEPQ